jgi:hypothetical protein
MLLVVPCTHLPVEKEKRIGDIRVTKSSWDWSGKYHDGKVSKHFFTKTIDTGLKDFPFQRTGTKVNGFLELSSVWSKKFF